MQTDKEGKAMIFLLYYFVCFLNRRLCQYHRRFRTISDTQLTKQGMEMILNRSFRNPQHTTNLFITVSLHNKMQDPRCRGESVRKGGGELCIRINLCSRRQLSGKYILPCRTHSIACNNSSDSIFFVKIPAAPFSKK